MAGVDKLILNQLDRQKISVNNYSIILNKLDSYTKKIEFLNYLNKNSKVILSSSEIILMAKEVAS